jgi:hypothetical protein
MRIFRRLSIVTFIIASLFASVGVTAAYANGPTYNFKYGTAIANPCIMHIGGGTAQGGWAHGQFDAYADAGGACRTSYVEIIYKDPRGYEQAIKQWWHGNYGFLNQIILSPSKYSRILEVVSYGYSYQAHQTNIVYLFY